MHGGGWKSVEKRGPAGGRRGERALTGRGREYTPGKFGSSFKITTKFCTKSSTSFRVVGPGNRRGSAGGRRNRGVAGTVSWTARRADAPAIVGACAGSGNRGTRGRAETRSRQRQERLHVATSGADAPSATIVGCAKRRGPGVRVHPVAKDAKSFVIFPMRPIPKRLARFATWMKAAASAGPAGSRAGPARGASCG